MSDKNQTLHYRPIHERVGDYQEVSLPTAAASARASAKRCLDCGVPFCQGDTGCPLANLIPEWNSLTISNNWSEASERLLATNNFPEFTSRLCPAPCESACVLDLDSAPVAIKSIERAISDYASANGGFAPQIAARKTGRKIAVVGSGPAGLACAQELVRKGHSVTVFEKSARAGGLLRFGIPDFKMQKDLIDLRVEQITAEGAEFKTGVEIGRNVSFAQLRKDFDAVALAIGSERPRDLLIDGRELSGIHFAMDYLVGQNHAHANAQAARIHLEGLDVIILGGGDTGSDCLGTALRQKAKSVRQFEIMSEPPPERSPSTPWPHWPVKFRSSHAHEEGGERFWNLTTSRFKGEGGRLRSLECRENNGGRVISFNADVVILALGYVGVTLDACAAFPELEIDDRGRVRTNLRMKTSLSDVYAAGDAKRGASLIVWAIAEGRKMAESISSDLLHADRIAQI